MDHPDLAAVSPAGGSSGGPANRALRLAFVTFQFPSEGDFAGGVGQELYRIALEMCARGCEVHVFVVTKSESGDRTHEGLEIHRVPSGDWHRRFRRWTRKRVPLSQSMRWLEAAFRIYRRMRAEHRRRRFDFGFYANTYGAGLFASLLLRVPAITWVGSFRPIQHAVVEIPYTADSRSIEGLESLQYQLAHRVWVPSHDTRRHMQAAGFERVEVVHKPIYLETAALDPSIYERRLAGRPYLLFFGRFQEVKGFPVLAEALPRAFARLPDLSVAFAGQDMPWRHGPSLRDHLLSLNREWRERITFLPSLPHAQLYPVIRGARLVVMPSLTENMPNACLEAMALGTPVIGSLGTSFEELIDDGKTGFLSPPGDAAALAARIVEAWRSPELPAIGEAARRSVERFAPERTVGEMLARIQAIVDSTR